MAELTTSDLERSYRSAIEAFRRDDYAAAAANPVGLATLSGLARVEIIGEQPAAPRYSIIVVNYRPNDDVAAQLEKLRPYQERPEFEILLVDNSPGEFGELAKRTLQRFVYLTVGFNYGCCGGRNVGLASARGEFVLFVDDDGLIADEALDALCETAERYQAVAVRGRILPKTPGSAIAPHYDQGDRIIPCVPSAEGMSIWRRTALAEIGGFDVLLSGHEGLKACTELYRFYGPTAFLYEPRGVLFHDFADDPASRQRKVALHNRNEHYLHWRELDFRSARRALGHFRSDPTLRRLFDEEVRLLAETTPSATPVSVITTARNGRGFLAEFTAGLRRQTHQAFELVFVDDGSTDGTAAELRRLWGDDPRLKLIEIPPTGRGGALNVASAHAGHELRVIADVDDIPMPRRLEVTASYFDRNPGRTCVSFHVFREARPFYFGRPHVHGRHSLAVRRLFGMPASFPTFGYRASHFTEAFDPSLAGGIDCDWVSRNFIARPQAGEMVPFNATYYRAHDGQISALKRDAQRDAAVKALRLAHSEFLGELSAADAALAEAFAGWSPLLVPDEEIMFYARRLIEANAGRIQQTEFEYVVHTNALEAIVRSRPRVPGLGERVQLASSASRALAARMARRFLPTPVRHSLRRMLAS